MIFAVTVGTSVPSSASSAATPAAPVVTPPSSGGGGGGSTYVAPTPTVDPAVSAADDAELGSLMPIELVAVTVNVYGVPFMSPVMEHEVVELEHV